MSRFQSPFCPNITPEKVTRRGFGCVMLGVFLGVLSAQAQPMVGQYGLFELTISSQTHHKNPFTDVNPVATVTGPDGASQRVRCFYDGASENGDGIWRFRYMPMATGDYRFAVESDDLELDGATGAFRCVASKRSGPIRPSSFNPHLTVYANGDSYVPVGDCAFFILSDQWDQKKRLTWIDDVASKGVNKVIMCMVNDDGPSVMPWLGDRHARDYTRFDLERMRAWEELVQHMDDRGVIAYLWFYSDDSSAIYPPKNSDVERQYFEYIVARFAAYENVVWNLALEYREYRDDVWARAMADLVKEEDPYDHLVAIHLGEDFPEPLYGSAIDVYSSQTRPRPIKTPEEIRAAVHKNQEQTNAAGKPIIFWTEEWCYEPREDERESVLNLMWTSTLQGGGYTIMSGNFWNREGQLNWWNDCDAVFAILLRRVHHFERMQIHNELVEGGGESRFCMANPGEEYLFLVTDDGELKLNLDERSDAISAEWWDIDTGEVSPLRLEADTFTNPIPVPCKQAVLHLAKR